MIQRQNHSLYTTSENWKLQLAWCQSLSLLLLDEPAGSLSEGEVDSLMENVCTLQKNGTALLVIEHTMKVIFALANQVVVLNEGSVIADGPPNRDPQRRTCYRGVSRTRFSKEVGEKMTDMLEIKSLSAGYTNYPVINDVSINVEEHSIVAVIGPNGAGKTTLMRAIMVS